MSARSDIDQDFGKRIRTAGSRVSLAFILDILAIPLQAGDDYLPFFGNHMASQISTFQTDILIDLTNTRTGNLLDRKTA